MPLCVFPLHTSVSTKSVSSERSQNGIAVRSYSNPIFGNPLNISEVPRLDETIDLNRWTDLRNSINNERQRRGLNNAFFSFIDRDVKVNDTHFQELKTVLIQSSARFTNDALTGASLNPIYASSDTAYSTNQDIDDNNGGAPQPGTTTFRAPGAPITPADVREGETIFASSINGIIQAINSASAQCVCNCNYCTCNCNYCTCNCNYACTCNCNYSDKRLKTNIMFSHMVDKLSIYKFSYIWNTKKTYVGVMAQDLLGTKYEDAVIKDKFGIYMVDYSKLPIEMKEV